MTLFQDQWANHDISTKTLTYVIELLNDAIEKEDFMLVERAITILTDPEEFSSDYINFDNE